MTVQAYQAKCTLGSEHASTPTWTNYCVSWEAFQSLTPGRENSSGTRPYHARLFWVTVAVCTACQSWLVAASLQDGNLFHIFIRYALILVAFQQPKTFSPDQRMKRWDEGWLEALLWLALAWYLAVFQQLRRFLPAFGFPAVLAWAGGLRWFSKCFRRTVRGPLRSSALARAQQKGLFLVK